MQIVTVPFPRCNTIRLQFFDHSILAEPTRGYSKYWIGLHLPTRTPGKCPGCLYAEAGIT